MYLKVYNHFFDKIYEMLNEEECEPSAQKDEWYITFRVRDDGQFDEISKRIDEISLQLFGKSDRRRRVRIRRCNQKCTVNFIC